VALILDLLRLAGGVALLYFGAEWLVRGAAGLARAFGVRPLVVGLTVVAYGTSAPEFVVSALAALEGKSAIALGNVVGSNIANVGLILGVTALIAPPRVDPALIRREVPVFVASAALIPLALIDGVISRVEGSLLVLGAAAFTWIMVSTAKAVNPSAEFAQQVKAEVADEVATEKELGKLALAGLAAVGLLVLVGGGKVFVDGAVGLALAVGMSERLVGLTIVAVGTSLPELAASVVAARRGHSAIAIGNVIGSNIFNVLLILGGASAVSPISGQLSAMTIDLVGLGVLTVAGAFFMAGDRVIARREGALLVGLYGGFLAALVFWPAG
jgi:cation:H+ antiporter